MEHILESFNHTLHFIVSGETAPMGLLALMVLVLLVGIVVVVVLFPAQARIKYVP
jgi:hypothetical protein